MGRSRESDFAEVMVGRLFLESFANDSSAYHSDFGEKKRKAALDKFRNRVRWHIGHSLSKRQKEVLRSYLEGKTEREIAHDLGITQQVVNIYKQRAIKRLRGIVVS